MTRPLSGEPALIAALARSFGSPPLDVMVGIGDDCAVLDPNGADCLLWTMDTLVEGVHFDLSYISLFQLGRKALTVNLSDIAAMGGEPLYALFSLGWPPARDTAGALALGKGLAQVARDYGTVVIGGDTVASPQGLMLTVAVMGRVPRGEMVPRSGARPGDRLYVTGLLGESAAGLEILKRGLHVDPLLKQALVTAHLEPQPQLQAGRLLARERLATALIDISDGVATDLAHICRASGVGARLDAALVPISFRVWQVAGMLDRNPLDLVLKGGEDYHLLFTSPNEKGEELFLAFARTGLDPPHLLGEIVPGEGVVLSSPKGDTEITGAGYNHFRFDQEYALNFA
jgi:thiamine-monophosphate kinase